MTRRGKYTLYALILAALAAMAIIDYVRQPKDYPMTGTNIRDLDAAAVTETIAKNKKLSDASQLYVDTGSYAVNLTDNFDWVEGCPLFVQFLYEKNGKYKAAQLSPFPEAEKYSVTGSFDWAEPKSHYLLQDFLEALQYLPQDEIRALQPDAYQYRVQLTQEGTPEDDDRSITYGPDGAAGLDGWYIHLTLYPMHARGDSSYAGYPEEAIELFYGRP